LGGRATRTHWLGVTSRARDTILLGPHGVNEVELFDFLFPITLGEAEIRVISPPDGRTLRVNFVLKTFTLAKANDFARVGVPGLSGEPLQFVRGHSRTLSTVLHFDGRATNTDVRQPMKQVMDLMNVDRDTHAPPVLSFEWRGFSFRCVLESTDEAFRSLFSDGRPSRGQLHVAFRESLTLQELVQEDRRE
jgi:hypothetical protein